MSKVRSCCLVLLALCGIWYPSVGLHGQGSSFVAPSPLITKHSGTGLQVDYTTGRIAVGGAIQTITSGAVTVTNSMTDCQAPTYLACNFLYWPGSGSALATSTNYRTAYASGNVVLAFVTSAAGNITAVTPAVVPIPPTISIGSYWVAPGACQAVVSGNSTGTNGLTVVGASNTYVIQAQTSASGTNTHTYQCNISPPVRPSAILDATFYYGIDTTNLGTQTATLASGTLNSTTVFRTITYPTPGNGETPSVVTPVRADSGTLTITPTVANFNVTSITAGAFYSVKFTPATRIAVSVDDLQVLLTVTLLNTATSATITNSPGVFVRYTR